MYINITHITGINEFHKEQLLDAGIFSVEDLIEATRPENLTATIKESGVWRAALLSYGSMARAIDNAEKDFYKRVSGGYLLFVEDDPADEPPDEDESEGRPLPCFYGFRVIGKPEKDRLFVRASSHREKASAAGIFIPPGRWIR